MQGSPDRARELVADSYIVTILILLDWEFIWSFPRCCNTCKPVLVPGSRHMEAQTDQNWNLAV